MTTLYGIKNCDTVRLAKRWLDDNAIDYQFNDFRDQPVEPVILGQWLEVCGAQTLVNKRSTTWKNLPATGKDKFADLGKADPGALTELLLAHPTLIKRPVLVLGKDDILVGFSPQIYQNKLK